jgi:hypothetical protein
MRITLIDWDLDVLAVLSRRWVSSLRGTLIGILVTAGCLVYGTTPVAAQVGIEAAERVLCRGRVGKIIPQVILIAIGLWSGYFILKFLVRLMIGLDKAGNPTVADGYLPLQIRDSCYSLIAALLPLFIGKFLTVIGIEVVSCLFPWIPSIPISP